MKNIEIELPILDLNTSWNQQINKVNEEINEVMYSTTIKETIDETFDVLQATFGLLLKTHIFIKDGNDRHIQKLINRKWKTKGKIRIIIEEDDD